MKTKRILFKIFILGGLWGSLLGNTFAQDLESILDEGSKLEKAPPSLRVSEKAHPLVEAMKKSIGSPNPEQNIFLRYLESADWDKALLQFPGAFEGTAFQKSSNGRALLGFVQFQAGLPVTGLQTLFMAPDLKVLDFTLKEEWKRMAPVNHEAWTLAKITWDPAWESVFGESLGLRLKVAEALASNKSIEELQNELQKLSAQAPTSSREKSAMDWQLVIAYSLNDQADRAAKLLAGLMKASHPPVRKDLMQLTAARLLFQNGYFDAAIKYYEKVSKTSDYWTEAQEEMGWAHLRKGEPHNAFALSQSLVAPALNDQVSPEAFLVRALSQLKLCDYSGLVSTLQNFPQRFKERTILLSKISQESVPEEVRQAVELLKAKKIHLQDLGKSAQKLPRRLVMDERLFQFVQNQKSLEAEAQVAEKLYAKSLALTGLQGHFEQLKQSSLLRAEAAKSAAFARIKELAQTEVDETKETLRKLHIVEAELIQQVSIVDKIAKHAKGQEEKKGITGYKGTADTLRFPLDGEIWFDDLSHYRVDVKKACTVKR